MKHTDVEELTEGDHHFVIVTERPMGPVEQILRLAEQKLVTQGWVRGAGALETKANGRDGVGPAHCLVGAVTRAAYELGGMKGNAHTTTFGLVAQRVLLESYAESVLDNDSGDPVAGITIVQWNDEKGRTIEEVLDVLDEAIHIASEEEL